MQDHVHFGAPPKLRPRTAGASRSFLVRNELSQVEATSTPEQLASSVNALKQSSSVLLRQRLQSPRPGSAAPQKTPRAPGAEMSSETKGIFMKPPMRPKSAHAATRQVSRHRMQLVQDPSNVLSSNQREDAELERLIATDSIKEDAVRPGVASATRSTVKRPFSAAAALYRLSILNQQEEVTVEMFPGRPAGGIKRPHSAAASSRYQPLKVREKSSSSLASCLSVVSRSSKAARSMSVLSSRSVQPRGDRLLASTREHNDNTFVYAVPRHFLEHGLSYDPYDIIPVTHETLFGGGSINQTQDARWDYYTISRAGYTFHLKKDEFRSTFLSLSDWETQKAQFTKLRSLPTFSRFRYRKVFVSWRQWVRSNKREAARENLITNCYFSYPILLSGMLEVRKELDRVSKLQLMLDFSGESSSLQDFTTANDKFLKTRTKELHQITTRLQTILTGVCRVFLDDTAPLHAGFPGHEFALSVRKSSNYHILESYVQCEQGLASAHRQLLQHKHFRSTRLTTSEAAEARNALMLSSIQENSPSQTEITLRSMARTDELEDIRWTMASIKRRKCKQLTKFVTLVDFLLLDIYSRVVKQSLDLFHDFILRGANAAKIRHLTDHDHLALAMHKTLRCSIQPAEEGTADPNLPKPLNRQRIPFKKQQIKAFFHTAWEGKLRTDSEETASLSTFATENRLEALFFSGLNKFTGSRTETFSIDDLYFVAENALIQLLVLPTFDAEAYSTDKEAANISNGHSSSAVEQEVLEIPCLGPQPLFTMDVATSAILEKRGRPKYQICFKPELAFLVRILQSIIQGFTDAFRAVPPLLSSPELRSVLDFADDIRALNLHSTFGSSSRQNVTVTPDLEATNDNGERFRCPADRLVERLEENSQYLSVRDDIQDLVRSALNGAEDLATSYSKILQLRQQNESVNFEFKARLFRRNEYSLDEMTNDATNFTNQIRALESLRLSANVEFLHFDMQQLQSELLPSPARCLDAMRELLPRLLREKCDQFLRYVNISSSKIEKPITQDLDAFTKYLLNLREVHDEILDKELDLTFLHDFFGVLNSLKFSAPVETTKAFELCDPEFQALKTHVQDAYTKRDADLQSYASLLTEHLKKLTRRMSSLQFSASDEALAAQSSTCQLARDKAVQLYEESQIAQEEARRLVRIQQVFEEASSGPRPPMKTFEDLDELAVELKLKRELWEAVCEADEHLTACSSDTIRSVDLEKMNVVASHVDAVVENIRQHLAKVAGFELDRLEKLQTTLHGLAPVIRDLRNPHLAERHWTKLEHKMQCSLAPTRVEDENVEVTAAEDGESASTSSRLDLQIQRLLQVNIVAHSTAIRHVSEEASAEAAIASSFMSVVRTWEVQEIPVEARRDRDGRDVYCIGDCGELTSLIEESQVLLRVMDLSTYSLVVQERLPRMLSDLNHTKESLELLQVCQRKWDFTQRLVSIDFARMFPEQAKQLQRHDTMWRSLTTGLFNRSLCLPFGVSSEHRQTLLLVLEGFEAAAKTLADHLEIKRQVFPAFFQLSDLELATLLSKSRDVNCISLFLYQCFDNVGEIVFGTRDKFQDILQIASRAYGEAEIIPMGKNMKARGPVEQWLAAVEKRLAEQLRRSTKQAIELMRFDSSDQTSDVDISHFTVQSLLLADRIVRCGIIENGLQDILNSTGSSRFERITSDLNAYSERVRHQLVPEASILSPREITLSSALRLQEIQFRDAFASHMASRQADSCVWSGDLTVDWDYQLKYRMDDASTVGHECHVEVNTLNIPYGFHYSSPHSDVVVTPSSFRSLFSLFACIRHGQGCLLTGGLESGKRTLSAQVSSILGRRHFTATLTSYTHATRLLIGALYAGGTFCASFQLGEDAACLIKTLATTLASIEHAVITKNIIVGVHRSPITFVPGTAMLLVFPSGSEITEDIRIWTESLSHFAVIQWDHEYIVEALLLSRGLTDLQRVSKRLLVLWENARSTYALATGSEESPFCFSALKRVINEAYQPPTPQELAIRETLLTYFQDRIGADQLIALETLIGNTFAAPVPDAFVQQTGATPELQETVRSAARELHLIPRNPMISSVLALTAALTFSASTILVGASGVGKTTTYQVLAKALELVFLQEESVSTPASGDNAPVPSQSVPLTHAKRSNSFVMNKVDNTPAPQVSVSVVLPMALTVTQLYGGVSLDGHGRVPSILGQLIRQAQELYVPPTANSGEKSVTGNPRESLLVLNHQVWVVFDDCLDLRWLEGLLAVLVNPISALLAFEDGEFMTLPRNLRFLFEVLTLRDATPSFLHVNSIVHLEADKTTVLSEVTPKVRRALPGDVASTISISTAYLHRYLALQRERMEQNEGSKWSSGDTFTVVEKWIVHSSLLEELGTILDTGSTEMIRLSPLQRVINLVSLLQSLLSTASTLPTTIPRTVKTEKMSAIPDSMLQFNQEIPTGQIRVEMALINSFMWGFAACTSGFSALQRQISDVLRREFDHLTAAWVHCGPNVNLFETLLDLQELRFVSVVSSSGLVALAPEPSTPSSFNSLFVPTSNSLVVHAAIREALRSGRGVLLLGGDNSRRTTLVRHFLGQLEVIRSIIAANGVKTQNNDEETDKTPKQKVIEAATLASVKRLRLRQISLVTWMALKLQKDPSTSENNLQSTSSSVTGTTTTDNQEIVEAEEGVPLAIAPSMDQSKTAMVRQFDRGDVIPFFFAMPHKGEAAIELANCFERMLQRERTGIFEPPPGKTALLLLDDLHLSTPESSKPLYPSVYTFLRSVQEHRKVYQGSNCLPISVENLMLFATMHTDRFQNPGNNEEALEKLTYQFFPVVSPSCGLEELHNVFEQALKSHWNVLKTTGTLATAVKNALPLVVAATTVLWNRLREMYQYNLQDLAKVYGGLAVVKPTLLSDVETLLRLWTHESCRTLKEPSMGLISFRQDTEITVEIARMRSLVAQITQRRASARASRLSFGAGMGLNFVPKRQSIVNQPSTDENVSPAALLALFEARSSVSSSKTQRPSLQFNSIQNQAELMGGLWAFVPSSIYYGGLEASDDSEPSVFRRRTSLMRRGLEEGDPLTKPWIYAEIIFEDESEAVATATMQMYFRDLRTFSSTSMQLRPGNPKEGVTLPRDVSHIPFKLALAVTRIDRVLARPAARLVLLTNTGSGADTLLRFATMSRIPEIPEFPVESGIFTFSGLKSDRNVTNSFHFLTLRWKRLLLELYERVGVAGQEATLVIKRLDLLPVAILNQIQTLMTTGEVPGTFSLEEQVHIATRVCDERLLALKAKHQSQVAQIRAQAEAARDEALAALHQQQREAPTTPLLDAFQLVEMKFQREIRSKLARVDLRWQQDTDDLRRQREVESESVAATVMALTRPLGVTSGKWASAVARMCSKLRVVLVIEKENEQRVRTTSPSLFSTCDVVSVPRADRDSLRTLVYGHFNAQFQQFCHEDEGFNTFLTELQRGLWSVACMATDMYLAVEKLSSEGEKPPLSRIFAMATFFPKFVLEMYNWEEASRAKTAWFLELSNRLDRDLGALRSSDILLTEQLSTVDQQLVEHEAKLVQQKEDADRIRVIMQRFQAAADEQITVTNEAQEIAQQELREPMACLEEANRALLLVDRRHIVEIKSFVSPPPLVHLVLGAVCVLFQLEPSWESARRLLLGDANVVQTLLQFNKDAVTATTLSKLETEFLNDERFSKEEVERQSVAASSMVNWVRAIHQYATARRQVQPTLDKLEKAQSRLQMIMKEFQVSQQRVLEADGAWQATQSAIDTAITRKTALRVEISSLDARCDSGELALEALKEDRKRQQEAANCSSMRRGFSLTTWNALLSAGTLAFACELSDFSIRDRIFQAWEAAYYHFGGLTPGCPPTSTQCTFLPSITVILKRSRPIKNETPLTFMFSGEYVEFEEFTKLISRVGGLGFSRRSLWDVWVLSLIESASLPVVITRFSSEIEEMVVKCAKRVWNWNQLHMVYARALDFDDVFRVAARLGQQLVVLDVEPIDSEPNGDAKCLFAAFSWELKQINGAKHLVVARKTHEEEEYTINDKEIADTIELHPNFRLILTSHATRAAFGEVLDLFPTLDGQLHSSDVAEMLLDTVWSSTDTGKDLKVALKEYCRLVEQYEAGHSQLTKLLEAAAVTSQFPLSQTKALRERLAVVQEVREELRENRREVQEQLRIVKRQCTPIARTGAAVFNAFNTSSSTPLALQSFIPLLLAAVTPANNELTTSMLKDTKAPSSRRISLLRRGSIAFSSSFRQSSSLGVSSEVLTNVLTRIKPFVAPNNWYRFILQVTLSLEEVDHNAHQGESGEVDELIPRSVGTILLQTKLKSSFITAEKCKAAICSSSRVDLQRKVVSTILNGSMLESEDESVDSIVHLTLPQASSRFERLRVCLTMFPECTQHVCDRILATYGVPINLQRGPSEAETGSESFWLHSMQFLPEETAVIVCTRHEFHSFGFARRVFFQGLENSVSVQVRVLQKLSERRFRSVKEEQATGQTTEQFVPLAQLYNFPKLVNSSEDDQEPELKRLVLLARDFKRIVEMEKTQLQALEEAPLAVVNVKASDVPHYWEALFQILNRSNHRTSSSAFQRHDRSIVPTGEALVRRPSTLAREASVVSKPPPLVKSLTRRTSTSQSLVRRRSVVDLMAPTYPRLVAAVDDLSSLPIHLRSNIVCFRDEYEGGSGENSICFRKCLQSTILRLVLYPSVQTLFTLVEPSEDDVVRVPVNYFWPVVTGLVFFHSILVFRANVLRTVYPGALAPTGIFHYSDGEFLTAINQFLTTILEKKHQNSPQRTGRTTGYNAALDRRMYQQVVLSSYTRQAAGHQEVEFLRKLFTECLQLATWLESSSGDRKLSSLQGTSRRMTVRGQLRPPNASTHSPSMPLIRGPSTMPIVNSSSNLGFLAFPSETLQPTDLSMGQWLELLWEYSLTIDQQKDLKLQTVLLGCQQSSNNRRGSLEDACRDVTNISGIEIGKSVPPKWMRTFGWPDSRAVLGDTGEIASTILLRVAIEVLRAIIAEALPPSFELERLSEVGHSIATQTMLLSTSVYNQHIEHWSVALEKILSSLQVSEIPDNNTSEVDVTLLEDPESGDEDEDVTGEETDRGEGNVLHLVDVEDAQVQQQVVAILSNEIPPGFVNQTTHPPTWSLHDVLQHYQDWHEFLNSTSSSTEPSRWWLPGIIASGFSVSYILGIAQLSTSSDSLLGFSLRLPRADDVQEEVEPPGNTNTVVVFDGLVLLGATWNDSDQQLERTSDTQAHQRVQLICSVSREKEISPSLQRVPLMCSGGGALLLECPLPMDASSLNSMISPFLMPVGSHYR